MACRLIGTKPSSQSMLVYVNSHFWQSLSLRDWRWEAAVTLGWMHYDDIIMGTIASQITSLTIVYSIVYSGADQSKHQSSASLAFVWGIYQGPVNSPHKWPVTRKMFPFDDVIMGCYVQRKRLLAPTGCRHRHPADENIDDAGNLHE